MSACVCVYMPGAHEVQKRMSGFLELELGKVANHHTGTGKSNQFA